MCDYSNAALLMSALLRASPPTRADATFCSAPVARLRHRAGRQSIRAGVRASLFVSAFRLRQPRSRKQSAQPPQNHEPPTLSNPQRRQYLARPQRRPRQRSSNPLRVHHLLCEFQPLSHLRPPGQRHETSRRDRLDKPGRLLQP